MLIQLLNGLFWGSLIALIALGLCMIYGQLGIINLAHGECYMLGAVIAFYVISITGSFWLSLIIAPALVTILGLLIERFVLRKIERDISATLIATYAVSLCLQYIVLYFFGGAPQRIADPIGIIFNLGGTGYPAYRIFIIIMACILFAGFTYFLNYTRYGLWVKGAGQDPYLAKVSGVPIKSIYLITFGLSSGFAALAGVLAAPITAVEFRMGTDIIVLAFMAVIIGGFGSLQGTFIASVIIGIIECELTSIMEAAYAKVLLLLLTCLFIFFRPEGLFVVPKSARRL
ncbi:branched-chain amino acid ABC transporter permease [Chitinophaga pinensis]|uniref:Inner-membrane translocator n=1 Tax=Chitinophaga pinensis (strain ATCC 43595 / DSM 2588 / LMG 13176 / NBRC 15968 / NCIMB 11800 / UQM 2034) TaxID=485918 RepID=A0A979GA26_CHIPD|nr:branched-chain amino acid ABC transporter permease [Chitinophaga pinensis]ACU63482.1 inner-membrane translocator [Chitinophaga pinensis DSM 2588]